MDENPSSVVVQWPSTQCSALAINYAGSHAVLGTQRGLIVVDLAKPGDTEHVLVHRSRSPVAVLRCCPHATNRKLVAAAVGEVAVIWDVDPRSKREVVATLFGHSGEISDLSWSPHEPDLLVSSSDDAQVLVWDIRAPKPAISFTYSRSSRRVQWHPSLPDTIASAHGVDVLVWDRRAPNNHTPGSIIGAHEQPIRSIDWSPAVAEELMTSSADELSVWTTSREPDIKAERERRSR